MIKEGLRVNAERKLVCQFQGGAPVVVVLMWISLLIVSVVYRSIISGFFVMILFADSKPSLLLRFTELDASWYKLGIF